MDTQRVRTRPGPVGGEPVGTDPAGDLSAEDMAPEDMAPEDMAPEDMAPEDMAPEGDGLPSGLVTFLFTDIEESTRLARALGPRYRQVLADHRRLLRYCLRSEHGAELLTEGDSFFAVFRDAGAALRACTRAQRALAAHPWPTPDTRPRVRMGLHTGYAVARHGEYASPEVHRAARIAAAAYGDQVLCSAATARAAERYLRTGAVRLADLGPHRLRGFDDRTRIHQLVAGGLRRDFPPPRTVDGRHHNLPEPPARFVGRGPERVELAVLVAEHRLVTVWGTGGVGKTRLAVEVARDLANRYLGGVWFCDVAGARDAGQVATAMVEALGIRPGCGQSSSAAVVEYLAGRDCLLLVDTCERRRPAVAALLARVLAACPRVTILATSREPLGVPGELVWRLAPLGTDGAADSDALALLVDRAGTGTSRRTADLNRLARTLAGLPLALELAASRLRALPAGLLADRLTGPDAGVVLARPPGRTGTVPDGPLPARHASLRANLDWSYRLLRPETARLLRWLSVWPGSVELAAVEWSAAGWLDQAAACAAVAELVDASLLEADLTDTSANYRMLEPLRWEVLRLAAESGELPQALARHRSWCRRSCRSGSRSAAVPAVR